MHEAVDKDEDDELAVTHPVVGSLSLRNIETDDDLAGLLPGLVREHVRDILLLPERLVECLRFRASDERKRDIPAGKRSTRYLRVRKTRRGAPRHVPDIEGCHCRKDYFLRPRGADRSILPSFTSSWNFAMRSERTSARL